MRANVKEYSQMTADERLEMLIDFNKSMAKSQTDLLPCFSKIVDNNFWDLIEKPKGK